ncbi:hypothetical protein G7054_g4906 [Neopestalotiopsis clavispora]|nr:hypothetical protein G7054_g4906 [Neopestalotiopsis clavispora]
MSDYKPTVKQDGSPDKRVGTGEFAHGKVDPHEAGKKGGHTSGSGGLGSDDSSAQGGDYKPTAHGGQRKDGEPDRRVKGNN